MGPELHRLTKGQKKSTQLLPICCDPSCFRRPHHLPGRTHQPAARQLGIHERLQRDVTFPQPTSLERRRRPLLRFRWIMQQMPHLDTTTPRQNSLRVTPIIRNDERLRHHPFYRPCRCTRQPVPLQDTSGLSAPAPADLTIARTNRRLHSRP